MDVKQILSFVEIIQLRCQINLTRICCCKIFVLMLNNCDKNKMPPHFHIFGAQLWQEYFAMRLAYCFHTTVKKIYCCDIFTQLWQGYIAFTTLYWYHTTVTRIYWCHNSILVSHSCNKNILLSQLYIGVTSAPLQLSRCQVCC